MEKKDFFDRFISLLENIKEKYELETIHDALIAWFGENYLCLDPEDIIERIIIDSHAEGVDAVLLDQTNYTLAFIQAKITDSFDNTQNNFPETKVKSTLEGIRFLLRGDYKGKITPELENLANEYHELDKTGDYKTVIFFLTLNNKPVDFKFIENFKKDFPQIEICFCDFEYLFDFYVNKYLAIRSAPPEKISFEILTNFLCKEIPIKSRAFTCKGKELAKIYNDYKERIFQQNVRYSLGLRSKGINKQILETAKSEARSKDFWYFNNGITIICKKIIETTSGKVINLVNAQIINGAQTTYALYEAYKEGKLRENAEILIKVIETDDKDFIENVTLYTNSQNAIKLRDLCSNDEIQIKIQKISLDSYKYFYERKRGELDSQYATVEAKKGLLGANWKKKLISNENGAQAFLAMFLNKPAQAKSEKGRIFLKDKAGFYDDVFNKNDDILAEKILLSWKLLKFIEMKKKEYSKYYNNAENLQEKKKNEIYKYDFLLHAEYFILNIIKDFLINDGFNFNTKKDDILKIVSKIDGNDTRILKYYEIVKEGLEECLRDLRTQPGYYHNKFFKSEKSIALVRAFFSKKFKFIEQIV